MPTLQPTRCEDWKEETRDPINTGPCNRYETGWEISFRNSYPRLDSMCFVYRVITHITPSLCFAPQTPFVVFFCCVFNVQLCNQTVVCFVSFNHCHCKKYIFDTHT